MLVERGAICDSVYFHRKGIYLTLDRAAFELCICIIRCLHRQLANPLEDIVHFLHSAFADFYKINAVLDIFICLRQAPDLRAHFL